MPLFESKRKAQVFGSSLALTLLSLFAKAHEIEKGSRLKVLYGLDGARVEAYVADAFWYDVGSTEKYEKIDNGLIERLLTFVD